MLAGRFLIAMVKYYTNTMDIETQKVNIDQQITDAAVKCGRSPSDIRLLAVSKTRTVDEIRLLAGLGQHEFGENYLQEAETKISQLADLDIIWHFIGQLQRNKTRIVAELFDWVQSVDRMVIAERLSAQRPEHKQDLNICLQVSTSDEPGKGGLPPGDVITTARQIKELPRIQLRGLMTIPENTDDDLRLHTAFQHMQALYKELKTEHPMIDTLSMGMSGDFATAIEHGSTMVRIGTALFGPRQYAGSQG